MNQCPEPFNLAEYVLCGDGYDQDSVALVITNERDRTEFSRADILSRVSVIQRRLEQLRLKRGARVAIRLPSSSDFANCHLAVTAMGLIAVPLSPMLTVEETRFIVDDSDASAIVHAGNALSVPSECSATLVDLDTTVEDSSSAPYFAATQPDDPAYLVYTSGTTGHPKGVLHAHRSVWGRRPMRDGWTGITSGDIVLHAGALNWTYTMGIAVYDAWSLGATAVIYDGEKHPNVWPSLIEAESATIFAAVPSVYRQMLKYGTGLKASLSSLRYGLTAGEALSPALLEQFQTVTRKPLYEALGMSECSTYISTPPGTQPVPGSPGRPQEGRRIAVLPYDSESEDPLPTGQSGLLAVHRSDPGLMMRYWRRPHENGAVFRGEWFIGGDLAHFDEQGYVFFDGRANDVMNAFGYRVSPEEVEAVVEAHPNVQEVGVAEARVRDDVSVVCAYVVRSSGSLQDAELRASIDAHCEGAMATYKRPREIRFLSVLPRTRSGKIRRGVLEKTWREDQ